jgi:hypothetical protein
MKLLKIMLAAALVLDAALVMTTTAVPTSSPAQAVGFNSDASGGIFAQGGVPSPNIQ